MGDYINDLMKNHKLQNDSITIVNMQDGGGDDNNKPYGGFPPIYICDKDEQRGNTQKKEYAKSKQTVSIGDIIKKRKKVEPLVSI